MARMGVIFLQFLALGCTSFGGPVAHIGYFERQFVSRRRWISEEDFTQLVSLCQLLPGPASSQLGFAIGLRHGGLGGAVAAFLGFTLPSFLLMYLLAVGGLLSSESTLLTAVIHHLKLLAVAVAMAACIDMARRFCRSRGSQMIAVVVASTLLMTSGLSPLLPVAVLFMVGCLGYILRSNESNRRRIPEPFRIRVFPLAVFVSCLALAIVFSESSHWVGIAADYYATGSLIFGGGHVVVPLLQPMVQKAVTTDAFLFGYAAAQAVPGPMFTLATFTGALALPNVPLLGALFATVAIFLPGFLLVLAFERGWQRLLASPGFEAVTMALNAGVVGLLAAAIYEPLFTHSVLSSVDMGLVVISLFLLLAFRLSVIWLILGCLVVSLRSLWG